MKTLAFVAARLIATTIFLTTWLYGVATYSSFAFDMFVSPRLFPPFNEFAAWHHAWFALAFVLSSATLVPIIRSAGYSVAKLAAIAYVLVLGATSMWLLLHPYLESMSGGVLHLAVVPGALLPVLALAVIDHLAAPTTTTTARGADSVALARAACAAMVVLWIAHIIAATTLGFPVGVSASVWALILDSSLVNIVVVPLIVITALAARSGHDGRWQYWGGVAVIALLMTETTRRLILPSLNIGGMSAAWIAATLAIALVAAWSGVLRHRFGRQPADGIAALMPATRTPLAAGLWILAAVGAAAVLTREVASTDWAHIGEQLIGLLEAAIVFSLVTPMFTGRRAAPPAVAVAWIAVLIVPVLALRGLSLVPAQTAERTVQPSIDRASSHDPLARTAAALIVSPPSLSVGFFQQLRGIEFSGWMQRPAVPPPILKTAFTPATPIPNVFMIVIDSLRRDYVSAYNPAVTFTPSLDAFARDSDVFTNAFTPHGGTWLAAPALWSGRPVTRGWATILPQSNLIETIVRDGRFDFVISDHNVEPRLRADTARTFLHRPVPTVQADLCQMLPTLQAHVLSRSSTAPVFAYLQPMNIHILNTRVGGGERDYPGFYAPYAARLDRLDGCLGTFMQFLKEQHLYDQSLIVITSDHGDLLGEHDAWGHQAFMDPEVVRVPLMIHLPASMKASAASDPARLALLTDLAPTLAWLLGSKSLDNRPPNGASLYAEPGSELPSREHDSFLLLSSYGPTYALLSEGGRSLYVAEVARMRESLFAIDGLAARAVPEDAATIRRDQTALAAKLDEFRRLYDHP